jgi:glycosyltransferase involved in cell wall biosynthesis
MKKILYVTSLSGKRLNSFMMSSIIAAHELNLEFHLACNFSYANLDLYKQDCKEKGIIMHQIDFDRSPYSFKNLRSYKQLKNLINSQKYEIIHCNTPIGGLITRIITGEKNKKLVVYTAHGFHFHKGGPLINWLIYYPVEKYLSRFTNTLITINEEDYLRSKSFISDQKVKIEGVGIDISEGKLFKQSSEKVRLISVGELNKNKNHITVLKALKALKNTDIEYEYFIYGEGKQRKNLERFIKANGLQNKVFLHGFSLNIKEKLLDSDIFIFPSLREGLSIALMEAMDSGLSCIVSNIRGNIDLIDSNGGIIVDKKQQQDYMIAIKKLVLSPHLRNQFGEYNRKKVKTHSLQNIVEKTKKVYIGILGDNNENNIS